ncbi:SDR family oxidoreductase [Segetibacter koreensis]|uniref:SDR family oxidoreductase n=1 Tax=Segetibacter koreensis TaxID=398037 RepID=UPI00037C28C8|nr:SDR family oxidoreductase [Segetibacter koreensis]
MKKILLTGANGFLGQHLTLSLQRAGCEVIATGRGESRIGRENKITYTAAELTNRNAVRTMLSNYKPDVIIHNAALSKPDECNSNRQLCRQVNVKATRFLLENDADHFIYISTDFVFGENGPHAEDEVTNPLNFYGESKLLAEQLVTESAIRATIVRPVFIYGQVWEGMRPGFLQWIKSSLEQKKVIKVVTDQLRTPTYAKDICGGIEKIITKQAEGIYHFAGKDVVSPYEMAVKTAEALQLDASLVEKVTAETFPEPVKRAKKSGLLIEKAKRELGYNPVSFDEGIKLTFGL